MNPGVFLFRELLGAMRVKSGLLLLGMIALIFIFLAVFSCFFILGTPDGSPPGPTASPGEITCYVSPRLSTDEIQGIYRRLIEREDVAAVTYVFAGELSPGRPGGAFRVRAADQRKIDALAGDLEKMDGIVEVAIPARTFSGDIQLPPAVRIGLLIGLLVSGLSILLIARIAFGELLRGFSPEIRLLLLSGTPERALQGPVIGLGVVSGLLASIVLIVVLYVIHASALSGAVLTAAAGLLDGSRVLTASLLSLLLGLLMGGLSGLLGASLLSRFHD